MVPNHVGPHHPWAQLAAHAGLAARYCRSTTSTTLTMIFRRSAIPTRCPRTTSRRSTAGSSIRFPTWRRRIRWSRAYLLQNALWWTESSGIDGFRIDTFPYVPRSFWSYYHQGLFATLSALLHRRRSQQHRSHGHFVLGRRPDRLRRHRHAPDYALRLSHVPGDWRCGGARRIGEEDRDRAAAGPLLSASRAAGYASSTITTRRASSPRPAARRKS